VTPSELRDIPIENLAIAAFEKARRARGYAVTYSPRVVIPLTSLCRDRGGYCTGSHAAAPLLSLDDVLAVALEGIAAGCTEALFSLSPTHEFRHDDVTRWLAERGYPSVVDYVASAARLVLESTGLLPRINSDGLSQEELEAFRAVSSSQGLMLESWSDRDARGPSRGDESNRPLETLRFAGELMIPFSVSVLMGHGEGRADRLDTLQAIRASHEEFGHVQEVIVQDCSPQSRAALTDESTASGAEFAWTVAAARLVLPESIHLQAAANHGGDLTSFLGWGVDDFGGISPVSAGHRTRERARSAVRLLGDRCDERGFLLTARLSVYPEFIAGASRFLDEKVRPSVLAHADAMFLARDDLWFSGSDVAPPDRPAAMATTSAVSSILKDYQPGYEFRRDELVTLFAARGADFNAVADLADQVRQDLVGDAVSFVVNRNINYTNVCTFKCRFCAFSKGPLSLDLRGDPYLLTLEEISERVREAEQLGATEVCMQGGIHPKFDGDYYIDVIAAVRAGSPSIHIHAFSALEVFEGARRSGQDLASYLGRLKDAGLKTLPGTAAEILDDSVRRELCPDKINSDQWLEVHRAAHGVGLHSNITIMFGAVESVDSWATHLLRTRDLQRETGGFTEFVPLPFVHMATPLFLKGRSRKGPTFRETLLMHAVARLHYATLIDNIQVSWVKMGVAGSRRILAAGANDLGGTLMDENISRAAGATHGQAMDVDNLRDLVAPLGRPLVQRSTLYQTL